VSHGIDSPSPPLGGSGERVPTGEEVGFSLGGTDGSNPSPPSGESYANLISSPSTAAFNHAGVLIPPTSAFQCPSAVSLEGVSCRQSIVAQAYPETGAGPNGQVRRLILSPRREHSRKPDEIYERIEELVEGPYIELFARASRDGWESWGDQPSLFNNGHISTRRFPSDLKKHPRTDLTSIADNENDS
jgi:hypothetical protein